MAFLVTKGYDRGELQHTITIVYKSCLISLYEEKGLNVVYEKLPRGFLPVQCTLYTACTLYTVEHCAVHMQPYRKHHTL